MRSVDFLGRSFDGKRTIVHKDLIKACTDDDDGTIYHDVLGKWCRLLVANGIKTTEHWLTAVKWTPVEVLIKVYGAALVGYLSQLAGVPLPGTFPGLAGCAGNHPPVVWMLICLLLSCAA